MSNLGWTPDWWRHVDAAAWIVDAEGRMVAANARARRLLGLQGEGWLGTPCHLIVRGVDEEGAEACTASCRARQVLQAGEPQRPFLMRRVSDEVPEWLLVFLVPIAPPDGERDLLIHLACPMNRYRRIAEYWEHLLADAGADLVPPKELLTSREQEILARLGRGEDVKRIARELHVSYATVRNHVQHILERLRVHSMQEAVGLHLLLDEEAGTS